MAEVVQPGTQDEDGVGTREEETAQEREPTDPKPTGPNKPESDLGGKGHE